MKKRSFIRNLSIMLFMQFVLLTALFVALIVHMRNSAVTEMETAADNVLAIYRVNLENRIERANNILKNLTLSEETALEMIRSDKESDRYYAKKSIYTAMHAALLQDNAVDLLIVAENSYGGYMESTNGDSSKWALPYETRKAVESFTWELLGSGTRKNSWTIQEIAGEPFLYRAYMRNGHIVAAYISVQNFFSSNTDPAISSLCLALTDSNGYVWKTIGSELKNIPLGQTMQALGSNWKVNQLEIGDSSLYVTSYLNEYGITYTTQTSVLSVILIAIVALGCSAAIIFYTRRQIIKPMKDMTEKLHDMNGVTEGFQIQTSYGSQEFLVLRDTFNRMMRENVDLRLSAYKHHMIPYRMWTARNTSNAAVSMPSSGQHPTSCAGSTVCRWWSSPGQRNLHDMPGCGRPSTKPVRMPALRKISTGRCIGKGIFSAVIHTENMQPSGRGMVVEPCGFIGWEKNTILQP